MTVILNSTYQWVMKIVQVRPATNPQKLLNSTLYKQLGSLNCANVLVCRLQYKNLLLLAMKTSPVRDKNYLVSNQFNPRFAFFFKLTNSA